MINWTKSQQTSKFLQCGIKRKSMLAHTYNKIVNNIDDIIFDQFLFNTYKVINCLILKIVLFKVMSIKFYCNYLLFFFSNEVFPSTTDIVVVYKHAINVYHSTVQLNQFQLLKTFYYFCNLTQKHPLKS